MLVLHWAVQVPVDVLHFGVAAGQLESLEHWTHFFVVGSQIGVVPGHSAAFEHVVPQVPVLVLQIGAVVDLQSELAAHWTQRCVAWLQIGADAGQSLFSVQPAWQVFVVALQTGVAAGQSVPVRHPTHVLFVVLQIGVVPVQAPVSVPVQATQTPCGSLHTG